MSNFIDKLNQNLLSIGEVMSGKVNSEIDNFFKSAYGKVFGTGLTGQQLAENAWTAAREDTQYQRGVEDMKAAGLNPALMYGSGAQPAPSSSSASQAPGGLSLSDMYALAQLPAQLKLIDAQTRVANEQAGRISADRSYIIQKTLTEEENTRLKSIIVAWQPRINSESVAKLSAEVDAIQANINLTKSNQDYIDSLKGAQDIVNSSLSAKIKSEIDSNNASARHNAAAAALVGVQAEYANKHKCLMSSSDFVVIASYLGNLFNTSPEAIVQKFLDYVKDGDLSTDFTPWKKVDSDDAMSWFIAHSEHGEKP